MLGGLPAFVVIFTIIHGAMVGIGGHFG